MARSTVLGIYKGSVALSLSLRCLPTQVGSSRSSPYQNVAVNIFIFNLKECTDSTTKKVSLVFLCGLSTTRDSKEYSLGMITHVSSVGSRSDTGVKIAYYPLKPSSLSSLDQVARLQRKMPRNSSCEQEQPPVLNVALLNKQLSA
jgi:hypothetical protein